jgi:hypothetical protein
MSHLISRPIDALVFATAGSSIFTIVSKKTQARFTFRMDKSDDGKIFFVKVLTGSDNTSDYTYLGTIKNAEKAPFVHGRKSKITPDATSAKAFSWVWPHLLEGEMDEIEFWHEGRCGRCARLLTVPESIARGIGPDCAEKMGLSLRAA